MFTVRHLTLTAMFIALGVLTPIIFHLVGAGSVFLPMHIPVLLAGFLAGPVAGLVTGVLTPVLSTVFTGMPPMVPPIAPVMVFELGVYGLVAGILYRRLRVHIFASLVVAMLAGRIVSGILNAFVLPMFGLPGSLVWAPLTVGLLTSWPGIVLQLVFVPLIVRAAGTLAVFES